MNGIECFSTFPSDPPCYFSLGKEKLLKIHGGKKEGFRLFISSLSLIHFLREEANVSSKYLRSDFHYPFFHGPILADLASNKYVFLHHKNANKSTPAL